jgi:hypothetical protein
VIDRSKLKAFLSWLRNEPVPPPEEAVELAQQQAELMLRLELVGRQIGVQVRRPYPGAGPLRGEYPGGPHPRDDDKHLMALTLLRG